MKKKTLEQAFNAKFHDGEAYKEFCDLDVEKEVEELHINSRSIFKTSDKLKEYLRFIDKVILEYLQKNELVVHSYIKEKSALTAVKAHTENKYFFITDIEDFFPNIKSDDVSSILTRDRSHIPISDFGEHIHKIVKLTTYKGAIPVGFVTSPKLSNAFLLQFDSELYKYCMEHSLTYTRYADDMIISSSSRDFINEIEAVVQGLLYEYASLNFQLKRVKTRKTHIGNKVKILGLVIMPNGEITIDSKYKRTLESLIYFYINDKAKYQKLLDQKLNGKERSLFGLLHYAKSIDLKYLGKLQRKYGAYVLSVLMENKWDD